MNHWRLARVRVVECVRDITQNSQRRVKRPRLIGQSLTQRSACQVFEDQVVDVCRAVVTDGIEPPDVRVIELRQDPRLALKAGDEAWIRRQIWGQDLEGNLEIELAVDGEVHRGHATNSERGSDDITLAN